MAPMRTFSVLQKWPKIAKMTPNDLLTLKMEPHWTAEENWKKHSFSFLKFVIFGDLERKNEFHGNHATYESYSMTNL